MKIPWKLIVLGLIVAGLATFLAASPPAREQVRHGWQRVVGEAAKAEAPRAEPPKPAGPKLPPGVVGVDKEQARTLGIETAEVLAQSEPVKLVVNGMTSYDLDSQTQIRPKFTGTVQKVYVTLGQSIKAGEPLVDVFSAELAKAKIEFEMKRAKAELDKKELDRSHRLFDAKPPSISEREYLSAVNDEKQSRQAAESAEDILQVYGLTHAEIESIAHETGDQKAKMTMRSPGPGIVVKRDVVVGNRYDMDNVLLNITPLDHFWVDGSVYPSDASRVQLGQMWEISIPFMDTKVRSKVESISSDIDERTRTFRIRATIPNINGRMKADLQVGGFLEIPQFTKDRVSMPRLALVSTDGADYVFLAEGGEPERYRRHVVRVIQENSDRVILVADDLFKAGARVATRGSLVLAQLFEDAGVAESGEPQ